MSDYGTFNQRIELVMMMADDIQSNAMMNLVMQLWLLFLIISRKDGSCHVDTAEKYG